MAALAPPPARAAWWAIGTSVLLHVAYNLMLVVTYRHGDYNQVYPVARGTAPPVVAVASVLIIGEQLSVAQVIGLLVLSGGLLTLALGGGHGSSRAVAFAVATGLLIAAYTVIDGIGVRHGHSVVGYAGWLFSGEALLTVLVLRSLRTAGPGRESRRVATRGVVSQGLAARGAAAGALALVAYLLVLWAQDHGGLAVVAALRETSVVFAAAIGAYVLGERLPSRRIGASVLVAAGAAALALG